MFYGIYLVGIIFWILRGIGGGFGTLLNYMDGFTGMFVLVPCVLILFCTQSFKAFGRAFLFAFGKRDGSVVSYRESLRSVRIPGFSHRNERQHSFDGRPFVHRIPGLAHAGSVGGYNFIGLSAADLYHPAAGLLYAEKTSDEQPLSILFS